MQKKRIIRNVAILVAFLLVGFGMIALLAAANGKKEDHKCKEVVISVKGSGEKYFIEKGDILSRLKQSEGSLVGKAIAVISLSTIEKSLKQNAWIKEAQLYFDSRDVLHVIVTEREPIARVFTTQGDSFYLDSTGARMPLLNKVSIRLPVITNFTAAKKWDSKDSVLVRDLATLLAYVNENDFWKAQIAQIDINANRAIELIPVVGNHVIKLGNVENLEQKLHNLLLFYQQVLSKTGFDVYKVIDIQYTGQVVGVKTNPTAAIDSVQLQKNIEALIEKTKAQAQNDSLFSEKVTQFVNEKDSAFRKLDSIITNPTSERKPNSGTDDHSVNNSKPLTSNTENKPQTNQATPQKKPRAVMPRRAG